MPTKKKAVTTGNQTFDELAAHALTIAAAAVRWSGVAARARQDAATARDRLHALRALLVARGLARWNRRKTGIVLVKAMR